MTIFASYLFFPPNFVSYPFCYFCTLFSSLTVTHQNLVSIYLFYLILFHFIVLQFILHHFILTILVNYVSHYFASQSIILYYTVLHYVLFFLSFPFLLILMSNIFFNFFNEYLGFFMRWNSLVKLFAI